MPDTIALPLAPMTPHAAISAFSYLRAVQVQDDKAAPEAEVHQGGLLPTVPPAASPRVRLLPRVSPTGRPARVWFAGYRCDGCEATRPQQFWDAMRDRYET
ncbi:hypothetical protein AAW14_37795 [Streptomyces hygroscopicus]|uniref:Uncharacterized protein n=1 Tax=Streptomyces showdoensis TaxID=68268 RepID=A0A2P2GEJ2_STREW|nr:MULTISPECIES: hypothetical protein [Streptomyces]KKZ69947.1 hypothetical protein VO63_31470 [Streptomyces showdoensis]MCW7947510.1 hypothetical protein [Streptomyces hygroscopicus]MCW7991365.1 hypothetical protein [Streptomyces platensis subsp. clarensis]